MEIAKKLFPDVECKWGEAGLEEIIQDASIIGVAVVLAGQIQANVPSLFCVCGRIHLEHVHIFPLG